MLGLFLHYLGRTDYRSHRKSVDPLIVSDAIAAVMPTRRAKVLVNRLKRIPVGINPAGAGHGCRQEGRRRRCEVSLRGRWSRSGFHAVAFR